MVIGPTFADEIAAAGLSGLPFSWSEDGVSYDPSMSGADRARIEAVLAAHDPERSALEPVPLSVTNFQARAVMRQVPMPDGRSLFTTVDTDLRAAVAQASQMNEFDPARIQADLNWQAWEQANEYERYGAITKLLAARYDFDAATTDDLFRKAKTVSA